MTEQTIEPQFWVILEFNSKEYGLIHKILCDFSETKGSMDSTNWKLSSGMVDLKEDTQGKFFTSLQHSGKVYKLHKNRNKFSDLTYDLFYNFQKDLTLAGLSVKIIAGVEGLEHLTKTKKL